jgi:hypothetical protein
MALGGHRDARERGWQRMAPPHSLAVNGGYKIKTSRAWPEPETGGCLPEKKIYGAAVTWTRRFFCQQSSVLSVQMGRSLP